MDPASLRRTHPTAQQIDVLLDYLEVRPDLAKGRLRCQAAKDRARRQWLRIAATLNSMGGASKTEKMWMKYWSDKKCAIKKKAGAIAAARRRTGGGVENVQELTEVENRIVAIMGGEGFWTGDQHLAINPFPEPSPPPSPAENAEELGALEVAPEAGSVNTISFEEVFTPRSPTSPTLQRSPPIFSRPVSRLASSLQRSSSRTSRLHGIGGSSTAPRRPRAQASPPSQRRSEFNRFTERFLRVEEQQLEIQRSHTRFLEGVLERERSLIEAVAKVGEGLLALANAISRP